MREIEFRVYYKTKGIYLYSQMFERSLELSLITFQFGHSQWKFNELIIEQFIGLKDGTRTEKFPEGRKVYEGDILEWKINNPPIRSLVYYNNELAMFILLRPGSFFVSCENINEMKIIGNINQNPELINIQKNIGG